MAFRTWSMVPNPSGLAMRDGVKLAADVYLPVKGDRAGQKEGSPLCWCGRPTETIEAETYYRYVQRGYAVVIQDVRGQESSEGEWLPMHYEVEDGDDTLNWIADQKWSDGKVAVAAGDSTWATSMAAAASENPHLTAMLSSVCAGSPFVDLPRRGGCFRAPGPCPGPLWYPDRDQTHPSWTGTTGTSFSDIRPWRTSRPRPWAIQCVLKEMVGWWIRTISGKWETGRSRTGAHRVPALIMSGWFDDNGMGTTEALDLYEDYTEKKVILGPWKHDGNADYDIHGFALAPECPAVRHRPGVLPDQSTVAPKGVENGMEKTARGGILYHGKRPVEDG